jgi:hypothetical protein
MVVVVAEQNGKNISDRNQHKSVPQFFKSSSFPCKIKAFNAISWLIAQY